MSCLRYFGCLLGGFAMLVAFPGTGRTSGATVESMALAKIGFAMHFYEIIFEGRTVTNWTDLKKMINVDQLNQTLVNKPGCPLEKHYVFVPGPVAMPSYYGETWAKVMAAGPSSSGGRLGRNVIYGNGDFYTRTWLPEHEVQSMLSKADIKLPEPEPAIIQAAEEAVKKYQQEQEQWRRSGDREAWRLRLLLLWQDVKGLFVTQGGTNPTGSATVPGRLRPVPVALGALALVGVGLLAYRIIQRRGRS
jgi:hypothetical protein